MTDAPPPEDALLESVVLSPADAVVFDFDGTLADLGLVPDSIHLSAEDHAALEALARSLGGAVAVLSGRDIRDLAKRTPAGLWRIGGHGLDMLGPEEVPPPMSEAPPEAVVAPLRAAAQAHEGVALELKGPIAGLHFRAARAAAEACLAAAFKAGEVTGYVVQEGKMVVEVKPARANKGAAVHRLAERAPFAGRRMIVLGDDVTDEDAMRAALTLPGPEGMRGLAVKVGEGESVAAIRAEGPAAVRAWLHREAARLRADA